MRVQTYLDVNGRIIGEAIESTVADDDKLPTGSAVVAYAATKSHSHGNIASGGTLGTASMVVITDANKKITTDSNISVTELGYLNGVTSNIQTQLNGKQASGSYAPTFTVETTGSGNAVTAISYANNKITATKGATYNNYSHPDSGVTAGTYHAVTVNAQGHVTAGSNPTTHTMTQVGGISQTYELQATGYKVVATLDKDTYWTTNSGQARIKLLVEYSRVPFGSTATVDVRKGIWLVRINYSGNDQGLVIESLGDSVGTGDGTLRYFRSYVPKNASYGPQIAVAQENANVKVYIRVTMLEGTPGWDILSSFGADPGTNNYNQWTPELGRYNYFWSSYKISASITGNCDGTANYTWDTIRNDRFKAGATAAWVNGSTSYAIVSARFCGLGSDGLIYHICTPDKTFALPFIGGRAPGNFGLSNTSAQLFVHQRGIATTELTNTNVANTAALSASTTYTGTGTAYAYNFVFSAPGASTAVITLAVGKPMYLCGNLDSNGNFKPYYTSATGQTVSVPKGQGGFTANTNVTMQKYTFYITQTPGYNANYNTCLYIGKADAANTTSFSYWTYHATAYTYNSSGKLTHIDGRPIQDSTYTLSGLGGVPTSRMINGYDLTTDRTLNGADVKITGYSKPSSASALAATDTINAALGKLEKGLDGKQASGSYAPAFTVETTGNGNAVTAVSYASNKITATKGSTFLTAHPTISTSSDTTSTASPAHSGTFTCVDSVTRDSNGHVTKINTKTVTLPASGNTDTLVKQTAQASTTTTYPLLFSAQSSPTSGTAYEAKYSTNCYVKSNKLYSNGTEVSVVGHTHDYLPTSTPFATINGTSVKSSTAFTVPTITKGTFTTLNAKSVCKLFTITSADYVANNYCAHIRFRIWSNNTTVQDNFTVDVHFSGIASNIVAFMGNTTIGSSSPIRYVASYVRNSLANAYDCYITVENGTTISRAMNIEVLEADIAYTLASGTLTASDPGTTNYTRDRIEVGNAYAIAVSGTISGNIAGSASSATSATSASSATTASGAWNLKNRAGIAARTITYVTSDSTVPGYPYCYSFDAINVSVSDIPVVMFGADELAKGCWAPICMTQTNGKIYIYSNVSQGTGTALQNRMIGYFTV